MTNLLIAYPTLFFCLSILGLLFSTLVVYGSVRRQIVARRTAREVAQFCAVAAVITARCHYCGRTDGHYCFGNI